MSGTSARGPGPPRCANVGKKAGRQDTKRGAAIAAADAAAASFRNDKIRSCQRDDDIDLDRLPSRIEPMSNIDTNEFKGSRQMTRKLAKWYENVGRAGAGSAKKPARVDGREWIEAQSSGVQRRSEYVDFDSLTLQKPTDGFERQSDDIETVAMAMSESRRAHHKATKSRDLEERMWAARHRPKVSGMSLSAVSWRGRTRGRVRDEATTRQHGSADDGELEQAGMGAGTRLREQALWLPVSECRLARSSRPGPDWCGAVLFEGGPSSARSLSTPQGDPAEELLEESSSAVVQRTTSKDHVATKDMFALDLWNGFSCKKTRRRSFSVRASQYRASS